jgi:hypothetical protein
MKSIILITVIMAILFSVSKLLIFNSEPVALILLGICLIGTAKIGRNQIKNKNLKYNWQTFMLLAGNTLFKKQENAK